MSYADGLLSEGERVVHREKQHWFVFTWGARWTLLAILVGLAIFLLREQLSIEQKAGSLYDVLGWVAVALVLGGLAVMLWTILRYLNHEYVVTNRRVLQVDGVLNKTSMDSSLEKINDARLSQSVFGRMFGFGDLDILTAADTGVDRFRMLRRPIQFKKAMLDAKHEYEQDLGGGDRTPSPPLRAETAPRQGPTNAPAPVSPAPVSPAPVSPGSTGSPGWSDSPGSPDRSDRPPIATRTDMDTIGDETASMSRPATHGRPASTPEELTRTLASLADLRDRGAISSEEFERKKGDLLSRL
ncbi:MAG: PH domain-containing protein [Candidatus Limnocylindrales bacterium]